MDRLTFREIEMINEQQKRDSNFMYLMIEFPHIHMDGTDCAVMYYEMVRTKFAIRIGFVCCACLLDSCFGRALNAVGMVVP